MVAALCTVCVLVGGVAVSQVWAAGTCTLAASEISGPKQFLIHECTADAVDGSFPVIPITGKKWGFSFTTEVFPTVGGVAPTDNSDIDIFDNGGVDLLQGAGTDIIDSIPDDGDYDIVSGNAYHMIRGTIYIHITGNEVPSANVTVITSIIY